MPGFWKIRKRRGYRTEFVEVHKVHKGDCRHGGWELSRQSRSRFCDVSVDYIIETGITPCATNSRFSALFPRAECEFLPTFRIRSSGYTRRFINCSGSRVTYNTGNSSNQDKPDSFGGPSFTQFLFKIHI